MPAIDTKESPTMSTYTPAASRTTEERTLANGLRCFRTTSTWDDGRLSVTDNTEHFVAIALTGTVNTRPGQVVFLRRHSDVDVQGFSPQGTTYHGFTDSGATVYANGDDEAARRFQAVRHPGGSVVRAIDHASYQRASQRHADLMAR